MFKQVKPENLPTYISKVESIFPEFLSPSRTSLEDVKRYYKESFWGYAVFHSWAGAIHMALSESGRFSKSDYLRQAEEVGDVIASLGAPRRVIEVGCGRGFNLAYLADRFPDVHFVGVDLTAENVDSARRSLSRFSNVEVRSGDFHDLTDFSDGEFDAAFGVETLCHAHDLPRALGAMRRILGQGAPLIVYDGYRGVSETELMSKAVKYTERAMAVDGFKEPETFKKAVLLANFDIQDVRDRSDEIMPNLVRLSDLAKAFFRLGPLSGLVLHTLPRGLVTNSVAGLLMAVTVQTGAHRYLSHKMVAG